MKTKLFLCVLLSMMLLVGCDDDKDIDINKYTDIGTSMIKIDNETSLYYRYDTRVVYIIMTQCNGSGQYATQAGYMSPYVSKNGKYCIYDDGEIKEIE